MSLSSLSAQQRGLFFELLICAEGICFVGANEKQIPASAHQILALHTDLAALAGMTILKQLAVRCRRNMAAILYTDEYNTRKYSRLFTRYDRRPTGRPDH